jgi:hypothetical protein
MVDDHASYPFVNCLPESDAAHQSRALADLAAHTQLPTFDTMIHSFQPMGRPCKLDQIESELRDRTSF